jgi:hypothetical protein
VGKEPVTENGEGRFLEENAGEEGQVGNAGMYF